MSEVKECEWWPEYEYYDYECTFEFKCGASFTLNEGASEDNKVNYCPGCGGKLKEIFIKENQDIKTK